MISVLVTGANGQLGRCLQDTAKKSKNIDWHFKTSKELNITNEIDVNNIFGKSKFDYLVNCAAYTNVDKAETNQEKAFLVNAEAVKYLADACQLNNTILIHISTDFVFDGTKNSAYKENDAPNPINVYGTSKLKGEVYIKDILEKYYIIRTSWVYSEYGNNFVKTMLRLSQERDEISVINDQLGSPTYAGDLAECILEIIKSRSKKYGIYHYSNEGKTSWYDFSRMIFEESNLQVKLLPIKSEFYQATALRPYNSVLDKSSIKKTFQIETPNWRDSLKKVIFNFMCNE